MKNAKMKNAKKIFILASALSFFSCKTATVVQEIQEERIEEERIQEKVEEKIEEKVEKSIEEKIPEEKIEGEIPEEENEESIKEKEICVIAKDNAKRTEDAEDVKSIEETMEEKAQKEIFEEKKPALKKIDMTKWRYIEADDVFFQTGIEYCAMPKDRTLQKIAIFVPGKYFDARKNSADFYTAKAKEEFSKAAYVMNTDLKSNMPLKASSKYEQKSKSFTKEGFIYIHAGSRAQTIVDFKCAIRFVRYNADLLPGDTEDFFVFGTGEGGIAAAKIALSGDDEAFDGELKENGAAETSDKVKGTGAWISFKREKDFSNADSKNADFAEQNAISLMQNSIDDFLSATEFPYKADFSSDRLPEPLRPGEFKAADGLLEGKIVRKPKRGIPNPNEESEYRAKKEKRDREMQGIFDTPKDYIAALNHAAKKNGGTDWILYDEKTNSAKITDANGLGFFLGDGKNERKNESKMNAENKFNSTILSMADSNSKKAGLWRIRFGIFESGIDIASENEFVQKLCKNGCTVDFKAVWQARSEEAEISGSIEENFARWLKENTK